MAGSLKIRCLLHFPYEGPAIIADWAAGFYCSAQALSGRPDFFTPVSKTTMFRIRSLFLTVLLLACTVSTGICTLQSQNRPVNRAKYRIHAIPVRARIAIDGILDEEAWSKAERATDFYRILPIDSGCARAQTEVMILYDESNLYMGIVCHDTLPGKRPVESMRRDFEFGKNDNFIAFIDTYNDQTNGFAFGISAGG